MNNSDLKLKVKIFVGRAEEVESETNEFLKTHSKIYYIRYAQDIRDCGIMVIYNDN